MTTSNFSSIETLLVLNWKYLDILPNWWTGKSIVKRLCWLWNEFWIVYIFTTPTLHTPFICLLHRLLMWFFFFLRIFFLFRNGITSQFQNDSHQLNSECQIEHWSSACIHFASILWTSIKTMGFLLYFTFIHVWQCLCGSSTELNSHKYW